MAITIRLTENNQALFADEDHLQVAQTTSFAGMIFELLSEQKPTPQQLKVFELILNLSIDHGPDTPSAVKVIEKARAGESISEAVAEGIEQINDSHGGAIKPAMEILYKVKSQKEKVESLVEEFIKNDKKIPGLGHRVYKDQDPRANLIFKYLQEAGMGQQFIELEKKLQQEFKDQSGKHLPINIDGAIAVALCSFGWEARLGNAVFIIARTPGLCGQYLNNSD